MKCVHWGHLQSLVCILAVGCAAGGGGMTTGRTDSGPAEVDAALTTPDAGTPRDVSVPRDTSMPDSFTPPPDAGPDTAASCGGAPPLSLMSSQLPRCSAATSACIDGCSTGACQTACLDADTTPPLNIDGRIIDCRSCLNVQNVDCSVAAGCHEEWNAFRCCEAGCGDLACAGACQNTHRSALTTCYQRFTGDCQGALQECFPG